MEIDRIQLGATKRVERSGSEQQRRRRQEHGPPFNAELAKAEHNPDGEPDTGSPRPSPPLPPAAVDVISIAGAAREIPAVTYKCPASSKQQPAAPQLADLPEDPDAATSGQRDRRAADNK